MLLYLYSSSMGVMASKYTLGNSAWSAQFVRFSHRIHGMVAPRGWGRGPPAPGAGAGGRMGCARRAAGALGLRLHVPGTAARALRRRRLAALATALCKHARQPWAILHIHRQPLSSAKMPNYIARRMRTGPVPPAGEEFIWANATAMLLNVVTWAAPAQCPLSALHVAVRAATPLAAWRPLPPPRLDRLDAAQVRHFQYE